MLTRGFVQVARLGGTQVRLHWSVLLGALVFGGVRFAPGLWLGYLLVIAVHEFGHAAAIRGLGLRVTGLDLTGFGGQCRFRGTATSLEHAWIAWGGVLAQLVVLLAVWACVSFAGAPTGRFAADVVEATIEVNAWIVAINLLPFPPLDGARAWGLFRELRAAGWSWRSLLLHPLRVWARQRRQRRGIGVGTAASSSEAEVEVEAASQEEEVIEPQPSAQAQRELAELLRRIGDEAGKARRRQ